MEDNFYRVSVKGLIFNDEWKFLLCKEDNWVWELPWGGLDFWEDFEQWLIREFMEEMWLTIIWIDTRPLCFFTWFENNKHKSNIIYNVEVEDVNFTKSDECQEIWFFTKEEALKLPLFPNVEKFLRYYYEI